MKKVHEAVEKKQGWLNEQLTAVSKLVKHQNPPVLVSQLCSAKEVSISHAFSGLAFNLCASFSLF